MSEPTVRCATCGQPAGGRFCALCGEKRLEAADHTLKQFLVHLLEAFTHADGKVFLTLRLLVTRPGRLTTDYLRGRRKPYIPPLQLFLIANLFFFLLHPLIGSNTLTTDLNTHLHYAWHRNIAGAFVAPRLAARALTAEAYAVAFDSRSVTLAKSLVILVVPVFSLAVLLLYGRHRPHYVAYLAFSLHFCGFWLLQTVATLSLTNLVMGLLRLADVFPSAEIVGRSVIGFNLVLMAAYLFCAVRVVFNREPIWITGLKAVALGLALDLSLQAYRFTLFFLTFWST